VYGKAFYDDVADALSSFLPPSLRDFNHYRTSHNLKLWFGESDREHYEVQVFKHKKDLVLEIGFHAEHKDASRNDEAVARVGSAAKKLHAEIGPFIGSQTNWRRVSELWANGTHELGDPELAIDAAERLATYILTLEPLRA